MEGRSYDLVPRHNDQVLNKLKKKKIRLVLQLKEEKKNVVSLAKNFLDDAGMLLRNYFLNKLQRDDSKHFKNVVQ